MFRHVKENPAYIMTVLSTHPASEIFSVFSGTFSASVSFQSLITLEAFTALLTFEGFLTTVNPLVCFQMR